MTSSHAFQAACRVIPGGVNSPVRAFKGVGGVPKFIARAQGAYIEDIDGKRYIDYVASYGPLINGHAHPVIVEAVTQAARSGMSFGAPTEMETALAETVVSRVQGAQMVRFCNSGTEATMSAIRLARAFTKRDKVLKFSGCYHGHVDSLLVSAGSGALTLGVMDSLGVPLDFIRHTLVAPYNDIDALNEIFAQQGDQLAAVIIEPIAGNMNCVIPDIAFHRMLRHLCNQYGVVLIWDEVMTGFRVARGGAVELLGITADLLTFGKVIGGGMPVGSLAGKQEIMSMLAPLGGVYQAGTLSGNPLAMAAGMANLTLTETDGFYSHLAENTERLTLGIRTQAQQHGISVVVNNVCGMLGIFFTNAPKVSNFADVQAADRDQFKEFFHHMLALGVYLAPSAYETMFVSAVHDVAIIDETIDIIGRAFALMR